MVVLDRGDHSLDCSTNFDEKEPRDLPVPAALSLLVATVCGYYSGNQVDQYQPEAQARALACASG